MCSRLCTPPNIPSVLAEKLAGSFTKEAMIPVGSQDNRLTFMLDPHLIKQTIICSQSNLLLDGNRRNEGSPDHLKQCYMGSQNISLPRCFCGHMHSGNSVHSNHLWEIHDASQI